MTERVYMVEQIGVHNARVVSCWASFELAEREVDRLLDKMPKRQGGSHGKWAKQPNRKRNSPNHGKTEMVWGCNSFGPSTNHISEFAVISFEVGGSAVERLAGLVT